MSAVQVGQAATRGVAGLLVFTVVTNFLQLVSSLVLARQLAPTQYGAFAVGATIVGLGRLLGDCGAGSVLIQEPGRGEVPRKELGQAFAVQATVAVVAAAALVLAAPYLRDAFDAPQGATWVIIILGLTLLVDAPCVVPLVRLRRTQQFQRIQVLTVVGFVALYAAQIGGLLAGFGLAALVSAQVVGVVVTTTALVMRGGGLVWPTFRGCWALARRGLPYQGTLVVQALFSVGSLSVAGVTLTTREIGLWTWSTVLATPLVGLTQNFQNLAFASFARLQEHGQERYDEAIATTARLQMMFVSAAVALLCGLTIPTIKLVFDPQWLAGAGAARAALLGTLPLTLATLLGAAVQGQGQPALRLRAISISSAVGVAVAVLLSRQFGVTGLATALYVVVPLIDVLILLVASPVDVRRAVANAFLVGVPTFLVGHQLAEDAQALSQLLTAAVITGAVALVLMPVVDLRPLRQGWKLLRRR